MFQCFELYSSYLTKHTIHLSKPWHNGFISFLVDKSPHSIIPFISICIFFCPFIPTNHSNPFSFYLQLYHESNLMTSAKLLNCPTRTGRPASAELREPRTLLVYYLSLGVSEFNWRAAGYSSHPSSCHAAHASSRSFRGSKIPSKKSSISVLSISSGYSFVSRPGMYIHLLPGKSRWKAKIFPCFLRILFRRLHGNSRRAPGA